MTRYEADLHIHTLLSPCAEVEMIPSLIIAAAQMAGLDLIAITDHNSCENAGAVIEAAKGSGLTVIPGMEVQSVEGVHLLALFDNLEDAKSMQELIYAALPVLPVAEKFYEQQMIVSAEDEFQGYCEHLISLPTSMEINEIFENVTSLNGMLIPSHIDKMETGICGVLGMLPEEPVFEAVEISANIDAVEARKRYNGLDTKPIFSSSDAHWLTAIGDRRTVLYLEHRSLEEIRRACRGECGRRIGDA